MDPTLGELCGEGAASSPPAEIHGYLGKKGLLFVKAALDFYTCEEWEAPLPGDLSLGLLSDSALDLLGNTQQNGMYIELDHLVLRDRLDAGF